MRTRESSTGYFAAGWLRLGALGRAGFSGRYGIILQKAKSTENWRRTHAKLVFGEARIS